MSVTRIGVIGFGQWGPNHVRVFSQLRGSVVTACADPDPERIDTLRESWPGVRPYADHRQMLREAELDAVAVATPTQLHYAIVKDALLAGRHVLCEKPLCVEVNEAVELVELARRRRLILMVGHVFLFNPGIVRLKKLVQAGEAGRLYYLRALRTNLGPVRCDVNSVFDLATHDISIFNYLLDAVPESVSAVGGRFIQPSLEDVASISLHYPNNVLAHILVSWLDPKKLREIVVVGDKRMLTWDDLAPIGPIMIYDKGLDCPPAYADYGQFQLLMREGDIMIPRVKLEEPLKKQNQFFLQCIRKARLPMNDGAFAVNVVRVLRAVTESLRRQSRSVAVRR